MGDSEEDDWFSKDISDFVVPVQEADGNAERNVSDGHVDNSYLLNFRLANENDYGGSCSKPEKINRNESKSKRTSHKNIGQPHIQRMSFKKLQETINLSPLNIFIEISQPQSGFFTLLSEYQLCLEDINCILKIYIELFSLELIENRLSLFKTFCENENLWNEILNNAKNLINDLKPNDNLLVNLNNFWSFIEIILNNNLIQSIVVDTPCNKFVVEIAHFLKSKNSKNLNAKLEMFQRFNENFQNFSNTVDTDEIYPNLSELKSTVPTYLKPNLINGCYQSVEDYLKIHRSLLREDFILPLKELAFNLTANKLTHATVQLKLNTVQEFKQYNNLLLLDFFPENRNKSMLKKFYAENKNNYKNGALLCLTKSVEFNDLVLVISNKNLDLLENGYLPIELIKFTDNKNLINTKFIMFESDVFFEPYHQVYNVLKTLDAHNFPMEKYIISLKENDNLPDYLANHANENILYTLNKYVHFDIKDVSSWPDEKKFAMNKSQLKAFQYALTRKFSLIQGPPGTGKTYIGLKLVETLLHNTNLQILIVCYTNHTLDQFLNGIKDITKSIVRFGTQSKDTSLDNFNIQTIKKSSVTDTKLKTLIYLANKKYTALLSQFELVNNDNRIDSNEVIKLQNDIKLASNHIYELKQIEYYSLIKNKRVIGMTTTCSARLNKMLNLLQTPIVIIEEAAQVLESHIIASLTKYTQHTVLIGDHKQLRPTTSVYRLAKQYNMNISLFERMINNNINCASLTIQKRMRPEIANLLRPSIYEHLEDDESVKHYADILGVEMNLFLVNSTNEEAKITNDKTRLNINEAKFLIAFANYLVMQGNKCSDITVLSFYNGQLTEMLKERHKYPLLADIAITSVDNFQGDENEIILLSLVRSSSESNNIGFLEFSNRICVALSRAKRGLFINGNINFLAKHSNYWLNIKTKLEQMNAVNTHLPLLLCKKHNQRSVVGTYHDLEKILMNGLCNKKCSSIMECGHECVKLCHNIFNVFNEHKCLSC